MLTEAGQKVAAGVRPDPDREVLDMVRRYLSEARQRRATGKLTFEVEVHDGGVTHLWAAPRYKER